MGALYGLGGYKIKTGGDLGYEVCAGASALLLASSLPRARKGPVPALLSATSAASLAYYGKTVSGVVAFNSGSLLH